MFKIGEFSRLSNTSVRMLRHYDKLELLTPHLIDDQSDYRYYQAAQLATVNKIKQLQALGFSLALIKDMLVNQPDITLERYFEIRQQEVTDELAQLKRQQLLIASATDIIQQHSTLPQYHVVEKWIPERQVISVRQVISSYEAETRLWEILGAEAEKQQVTLTSPPLGLTLYHGDEYQEQNIDTEVQSAVKGRYLNTDLVHFKRVPDTHVASVTFNGSYDQMPSVAEAVATWMEINQYQLAGPMFNIFHVSPADSQIQEDWVTEACYQITPRKDEA
ncbi:MerR family transcriptional regulator [Vagococcus sp. BWB3-3]|uniref:MerR family transcriptional regulator n=1 Tax=Vagococcus allomyrinae TaxID=2794353 RepID=A0A940PEI0_9ENTE|nr:MerR family transcriptional regulator [Vagococcus allomyrinae]MBP1043112.1 MerR family transcriptional regulator [Vagococcus allomyrinae]